MKIRSFFFMKYSMQMYTITEPNIRIHRYRPNSLFWVIRDTRAAKSVAAIA